MDSLGKVWNHIYSGRRNRSALWLLILTLNLALYKYSYLLTYLLIYQTCFLAEDSLMTDKQSTDIPNLNLAPTLCVYPSFFIKRFGIRKLVWRCSRNQKFSRFLAEDSLMTDKQSTDMRTNRARAVKSHCYDRHIFEPNVSYRRIIIIRVVVFLFISSLLLLLACFVFWCVYIYCFVLLLCNKRIMIIIIIRRCGSIVAKNYKRCYQKEC